MYVDWVSYTPFKDQPCIEYVPSVTSSQVATLNEYPSQPIATATVNKVANGNFEYVQYGAENSGWSSWLRKLNSSEKAALKETCLKNNPQMTDAQVNEVINTYLSADLSDVCKIDEDIGYKSSCGVKVEDLGLLEQVIDSIYQNFNINFSFYAKGTGEVTLLYYGNGESDMIDSVTIKVDESDWKKFEFSATMPEGVKQIYIDLSANIGTSLYADEICLKVV
jgi:hypothetical protein